MTRSFLVVCQIDNIADWTIALLVAPRDLDQWVGDCVTVG